MLNNLEGALIGAWLDGNDEAAKVIAELLELMVICRLPAKYLLSLPTDTEAELIGFIAIVLRGRMAIEIARHPELSNLKNCS